MLVNGIFEGGGIKGLAYVGVLRFLEERGFQFNYVGGTSVGAVFASLISVGYNSRDLEKLINSFDVNILRYTESEKKIPWLIKGIKQRGLYSLEKFEEYLHNLNKMKNKVNFRDVKLGNNYLLKVITTDLKNKKIVYLPKDIKQYGYSPDGFPISKAVVMSSTIPLIFGPYMLEKNAFIDGGAVNNFPIDLFSDSHIPTLGFRLNTPSIKFNKIIDSCKKRVFKVDFQYNFDQYNIIEIDTLGIKASEFKRGLDNRNQLFLSGYNSMRDYFYKNVKY